MPILHDPLLRISFLASSTLSTTVQLQRPSLTPTAALSTLMTFLLHADPSPTLISTLLSPIMTSLYALSAHLDHTKTADPLLKECVNGLLATWGRVVVSEECLENLWRVIEGEGGEWNVDIAGEVKRVERSVILVGP